MASGDSIWKYDIAAYHDSELSGFAHRVGAADWTGAELAAHTFLAQGLYVRIEEGATGKASVIDPKSYGSRAGYFPDSFPISPWNLGAEWVNCGDADYLDYGGTQIRRSEREGSYDVVLVCELPYDAQGHDTHMFAGHTTIDLVDCFPAESQSLVKGDAVLAAADLIEARGCQPIAEYVESQGFFELSMGAFGEEGAWAGYSMSFDAYLIDKLDLGVALAGLGIDVADGLQRYAAIVARDEDKYMMLSRLKQGCDYFLYKDANGTPTIPEGRNILTAQNCLGAGTVEKQVAKMRELLDEVFFKPDWLTAKDIDGYEREMLALRDADPAGNLLGVAKRLSDFFRKYYYDFARWDSDAPGRDIMPDVAEAQSMVLDDPNGLMDIIEGALELFDDSVLGDDKLIASEARGLLRDIGIVAKTSPMDESSRETPPPSPLGMGAPSLGHAQERS